MSSMTKDNEQNHSHSTANILDSLREEALPDINLSPDSPVRKKRDTDRFNAMLSAAFIKLIRIKNIIFAHWKLQIEKAIQKYEKEIKAQREKLINFQIMLVQQSQLSSKQLLEIYSINKR